MTELTPDDLSLITESLKQLWFTRKNERIMEADLGTETIAHLFETIGDITEQSILKFQMMKTARTYEPRIVINDITILTHPDIETGYLIKVDCTVVKFRKSTTLELTYIPT